MIWGLGVMGWFWGHRLGLGSEFGVLGSWVGVGVLDWGHGVIGWFWGHNLGSWVGVMIWGHGVVGWFWGHNLGSLGHRLGLGS